MGRYHVERDEDDDEEEWEGDDPDDDGMMPCPRCSAPIFDESERCPECGAYLTIEEGGPRKPMWILLGVAACLGMVGYWVVHFF